MRPLVRREAGIVAADDDPDVGSERAHEPDDPARGGPLEGHHREPDHVGLLLADEPFDGRANGRLREDQIGDRNVVMRIEIACERSERPIRHPHRYGRRVLERIRHREQQDAHQGSGIRDRGSGISDQIRPSPSP